MTRDPMVRQVVSVAACRVACLIACVVACVAGIATGCASTSREAELGIGWRKGTVIQLGDAASFGPPVAGDCRARSADEGDARLFALVEYFSGRLAHRRIVPMAAGQPVAIGEPIYISLLGCKESVPR